MNRIKIIALTAITSLAVVAVLYTSCNKDKCQGVTCFNNSTCSNGSCKCPPGFSGTQCTVRANTSIIYQNNTFSEVEIQVTTAIGTNSNEISPGGAFTVTGGFGTEAVANVSTFSGQGEQLTWNLVDSFPSGGVTTVPINAPSSYFFLKVINNNTQYYVDQIVVNYDLSSQQTVTSLYIYNDGSAHAIGYFHALSNSNVYLYNTSNAQSWNFTSLALPDTVNQVYTAILN